MKFSTLVMLATLLFVTAGCQSSKAKESLPPASGSGALPPPKIPTVGATASSEAAAKNGHFVVTGTARPKREAKVGPKNSGMIAAMKVEEGDEVKKGQLLFSLEAADQAIGVSQANAALNSAVIAESTAKRELDRLTPLKKSGSISEAQYDQMKAQFDAAQAGVKQARAAVARAKQATSDTAIRSPIKGVVVKRHSSVGDTVTMMPPTVVLVIQDISELEVRGRAPETMLKRIKPGSPIKVRFLAIGEERTVPIERINPSVDPITRTIEVVALVPNKDRALLSGMLVELDFGAMDDSGPAPASSASLGATAKSGKKP